MSRSRYSSDVPLTRPPPRDTEVSSSLISPRTPVVSGVDSRRGSAAHSYRKSWSPSVRETEVTRDQRRRSTISFAGPSLAPSDSISKVKTHSPRSSRDYGSATTSRRRSAPWQSVSYQSRASRGSSLSGAAWSGSGAPLTETNLEVLNEARSSGPADDKVDREFAAETSARRTGNSTRRYSQAITDESPAEVTTPAKESRRSSRRSGTATGKQWPEDEDYTAASSRRRSTVTGDTAQTSRRRSTVTGDTTQTSTPRYARPTAASRASSSRIPTQAARRTTVAPNGTAVQASVSSSTRYGRASQSRAVTSVPSKTVADETAGEDIAVAAAYTSRDREVSRSETTVASRTQGDSENTTLSRGQTTTKRNAPTEMKSGRQSASATEANSSPATKSGSATMVSKSSPTARQSKSASRATGPQGPSQTQGPSVPDSASSATAPTPAAAPYVTEWERRIHIVTTLKPDGRLIRDRQVTMRRLGPQSQAVGA